MSMKNDISFIFNFSLHLYEHQSTNNPNMPLRNLFYVTTLLGKMVDNKKLYGSKPITIPAPKFVVFYNGVDKDLPEVSEYKLSDLYAKVPASSPHPRKQGIRQSPKKYSTPPDLELIVKVLNINDDMSYNIKQHCDKLKAYCIYVSKIREFKKSMPLNEAIELALNYCIDNNLEKEFFSCQRAEVKRMSILEFTEEDMIQLRQEEKEEARAEGRAEERKVTASIINNLFKKDYTIEEISELIDLPVDTINEYINSESVE